MPQLFNTPHFIEQVTEDQIRAMVHQLTYRAYDPLSRVERDRVHLVALYQARAAKQYAQVVARG